MSLRPNKADQERRALRKKWGLHTTENVVDRSHWRHVPSIPERMLRVLEAQWDVTEDMFQEGVAIWTAMVVTHRNPKTNCDETFYKYHVRADLGYDALHVVWHAVSRCWIVLDD